MECVAPSYCDQDSRWFCARIGGKGWNALHLRTAIKTKTQTHRCETVEGHSDWVKGARGASFYKSLPARAEAGGRRSGACVQKNNGARSDLERRNQACRRCRLLIPLHSLWFAHGTQSQGSDALGMVRFVRFVRFVHISAMVRFLASARCP